MLNLSKGQLGTVVRYGIVGLSGSVIDLGLLYILVEYRHWGVLSASAFAFVFAVFNNFYWNRRWTFRSTNKQVVRQYLKYFIVSTLGLGLNTLCLYFFITSFKIWYIFAKVLTSGIIFLWNFMSNKFWTFRDYSIARPVITSVPSCDLSVVIPAYNEEKNISHVLDSTLTYLKGLHKTFEIIVVNDGSSDKTSLIVQSFHRRETAVREIVLKKNSGKGAAVQAGMLQAQGAVILFVDADGSTPIQECEKIFPELSRGHDIVIGSRHLSDSIIHIKQPWYRIALGRIANLLIRALLLEGIADTQCGFKAFSYTAAYSIFPRQRIEGWGFDVEVLAIGKQMGFSIKEIPVSWYNATNRISRLRPLRDAHRTLRDLLLIKFNLWTGKYQ